MNSNKLLTGYTSIESLESDLRSKPEQYWISRGEQNVLKLFHAMAQRVPAYKDFLKKNKLDHEKIKTIADFKNVPLVDKENYLKKYSLENLCWDGVLNKKRMTIAATSGSTGEPFYFPREKEQDLQYALTAELYLRNNFNISNRTTLYINGFGMGIWIGGVFTYEAIKTLAENGDYPISIVTPGSSKSEIINVVRKLGKKYDQIIIGGYPPLIKDMLDQGDQQGINWGEYNLHFIFSAEGFSEGFRDYVLQLAKIKNTYVGTLNHIGTVDMGTMAHETPLSILIRRSLVEKKLTNEVFHRSNKQPTLTQYLPELFYFESLNNQLVCSARSGLPLVRYDLKDTGNIISLTNMSAALNRINVDLDSLIREKNIQKLIWNLPFVYVFERSDFTVKLSGANIYPEEIKRALQQSSLSSFITGKFTMEILFNKSQDQYLNINIELKDGKSSSTKLKKLVTQTIIKQLLEDNSEYNYLYSNMPKNRLEPKVIFWKYEDPKYFKMGTKQKWVLK